MGDITDMILEGILCDKCGQLLDTVVETGEPVGYPETCENCKE